MQNLACPNHDHSKLSAIEASTSPCGSAAQVSSYAGATAAPPVQVLSGRGHP